MKKAISMILALALCAVFTGAAFAEGLDITSVLLLSDEELLSLLDAVQAEVDLRHLDDPPVFGQWGKGEMGKRVPDPEVVFGRKPEKFKTVDTDSDTMFVDALSGITQEEYEAFRDAAILYGFTYGEVISSGRHYTAYSQDGLFLQVDYMSGTLFVELTPMK